MKNKIWILGGNIFFIYKLSPDVILYSNLVEQMYIISDFSQQLASCPISLCEKGHHLELECGDFQFFEMENVELLLFC